MKKYYTDEGDLGICLCCSINAADVVAAEEELRAYMAKRGKTYDLDKFKTPSLHRFFELYFGDYDAYDDYYSSPEKYVCTDKNVAERFMHMVSRLAFHDRFNQHYCDVEKRGNEIVIMYGVY